MEFSLCNRIKTLPNVFPRQTGIKVRTPEPNDLRFAGPNIITSLFSWVERERSPKKNGYPQQQQVAL